MRERIGNKALALAIAMLVFAHADGVWADEGAVVPDVEVAPEVDTTTETDPESLDDLMKLSLEELMNIEVYSVAKKKQKVADSAAAVYVLTNEDIRRSGATNVPEALRLVPGVEVAHIDSNKWAITIRGFNDRFANKLLVLIDGRSVYTPLFAGVYWDVQDLLLEDVDRIEVIRGPGGTLWGANAVNGVINIITKSAHDTQGVFASYGMGNELDYNTALRYGGKLGENAAYRLYGKWFQRDDFRMRDSTTGELSNGRDGWRQGRGGFRADWSMGENDEFMAEGEMYSGRSNSSIRRPDLAAPFVLPSELERTDVAGGHLLARWRHGWSERSNTEFQAYYDRTHRKSNHSGDMEFRADRDTVDLELQHNVELWQMLDLVGGLGYRVTADDLRNEFRFSWEPKSRDTQLFNMFLQGELRLLEDDLKFTAGIKLEHNDYTDWEWQPNFRFLWHPLERHTLWGSVSRAVRTPSRSEDDITLNTMRLPDPTDPAAPPLPTVVQFNGSRGYDSERLWAFELGYRAQLHDTFSIDIAGYYNDYDDLRSITAAAAPSCISGVPLPPVPCDGGPLLAPFVVSNFMDGEAYGVEIAADWSPTDFVLLRAGYTWMDISLDLNTTTKALGDSISKQQAGQSPQNQAFVHGFLDLPRNVDADLVVRYVDRLQNIDVSSYVTVDLRLAWEPVDGLEFAFVGQNLNEKRHSEFVSSDLVASDPSKVERSFFGTVTFRR